MEVGEKPKKIRRIWVPQVAVDVETLRMRLGVAVARGDLDPPRLALVEGIGRHLDRAEKAAFRQDPLPGRLANWWRGTLVESAYRNMHAAEAQLVDLYDEDELQAEIPLAVARARNALHREDLRQWTVEGLRGVPKPMLRHQLRRLMSDSFAALDARHGQLRNFRNVVLLAALLIIVLVVLTVVLVAASPEVMPLCFPNEVTVRTDPLMTEVDGLNCPTAAGTDAPSSRDVLIVALLGLLGGALAASVSIRNLKGTTSPYDVPVALALLKVPLGAFTAILALVAIRGDFVPGLSTLDSQEQILAYALVFGFGQQVFTRLLDQRAQTLLEHLPSKDASDQPPQPPPRTPPTPTAPKAAAPPTPETVPPPPPAELEAPRRGIIRRPGRRGTGSGTTA